MTTATTTITGDDSSVMLFYYDLVRKDGKMCNNYPVHSSGIIVLLPI